LVNRHADIAEHKIRKYRKVLGDSYYREFSKAVGLFSHGVGVGSFVYLRRIIENFIVKPAYDLAKAKTGWDEVAYQKSRVKERIRLLKNELPEFLSQNPHIYSVLSKGIHELTEDECKEYFPVLKDCIELVLTEIVAKKQIEQKRKDVEAKLGLISGAIK
jgi:hypothetical protein